MVSYSILYKLLVLTLCFGRDVGQSNHCIAEYTPRIHTAVFAIPAVSASLTAILEAIVSTTGALLAAKAAHDWHKVHRLEKELREL